MKAIKYILPLLLTLLLFSTCKKDYPKDIPDWLEDRIKEEKKNCRPLSKEICNCDGGNCLEIKEYTTNINETVYEFRKSSLEGGYFLDYDGNSLCAYNYLWTNCVDSCVYFTYCDIQLTREIWIQKQK